MREAEFVHQLALLLEADVAGLGRAQKIELIQALCDEAQRAALRDLPTCQIVPFVRGRRPSDEVAHPGLGSSDSTSLIMDQTDPENNKTYLLYYVTRLEEYSLEERDSFALDLTLSFAGTDGALELAPIPSWDKRPVEPAVFEAGDSGKLTLRAIPLRNVGGKTLVIALSPDRDFLPDREWRWKDVDMHIREAATDFFDPFTFGHMFSQQLHVSLRLTHHGVPVSTSQTWIDICDTRRFGSLYQRIIERVIQPDMDRQAHAAGLSALDIAYHPWFPVLRIGADKAALYTDALIEDIVHKKRHLTDPHWLIRVGLYLEFLTCLGVFEAVKDELGDLLTPAERAQYEHNPIFAEIRKRINPRSWRNVWSLRDMAFHKFGVPQTGPVSILNLLQKKKATLAFLRVHHEDLKNALELAGPNDHNAQETWHRVFRDAERAVLHYTAHAFPELAFLDSHVKDFILWHQKGQSGLRWVPKQFSHFLGDQDGLYASACNQYRASMNEVAEWAKRHGLMEYTGTECIPERVSLLHAHVRGQEAQLTRLQRRDGYAGRLQIDAKLPDEYKYQASSERFYALLREVPFFAILNEDELRQLAGTAREIELGPMERIIVEGREGTSLFVVGEGQLEVLIRQRDGTDKVVDIKKRGDVIGEISLLTGARRTATVRAVDGAVVYEIGKKQYEPIIKARPAIVDQLTVIMEIHLRNTREQQETGAIEKESAALGQRIRRFFFGV